MSDFISKRELYRKLGEVYNKGFLPWGANEIFKDIIGECDSVEIKGEWIPVSERLPLFLNTYKISDDVLITNGYEIDMGYLVERNGKIFWHYYGSEVEIGIKDEDNDATAWMPLPEPYKAEKGGE